MDLLASKLKWAGFCNSGAQISKNHPVLGSPQARSVNVGNSILKPRFLLAIHVNAVMAVQS